MNWVRGVRSGDITHADTCAGRSGSNLSVWWTSIVNREYTWVTLMLSTGPLSYIDILLGYLNAPSRSITPPDCARLRRW